MFYRQAPTFVGPTTTSYRDKMSTSHNSSLDDVFTTVNYRLSSDPPTTKVPTVTTKHSAVTSDSLPSLSKPIVTTVNPPAITDPPTTASTVPRIGGKQSATTGTKSSSKSAAGNLKSDILRSPINQTTKCVTSTNTITGIVPVTTSRPTLYTDNWRCPSVSKPEAAYNNTTTKPTSLVNEISTSTSRPSITSHSRSPSFDSKYIYL